MASRNVPPPMAVTVPTMVHPSASIPTPPAVMAPLTANATVPTLSASRTRSACEQRERANVRVEVVYRGQADSRAMGMLSAAGPRRTIEYYDRRTKRNHCVMVIKTNACVHTLGTIGCSASARSTREQIGTWCSRSKINVQHQHEKGGDRWPCNCGCKGGVEREERDECMRSGKVGRTSRRREALLRRTRATATEASDRAGHRPPTRPQTLQRHGLQQSPAPPNTHIGLMMMVQCVARDAQRYARCD
jgi:hypothetical protein